MEIGLLVYPRHTPLDLVGPWEVLVRVPHASMHLIWTRPGPVQAEGGMEITATTSFADAPPLDVLLVPGGPGQLTLMKHTLLLDYIRDCSETAQWVCSICTGALLLAQAGVLKGRRATTHWLARDALRTFDIEVTGERYVIDGKFMTSAGVTAGIDVALELARRLAGDDVAGEIQLQLQYDPAPSLQSGSPDSAPPELVSRLRSRARRYR
ncbi:MAG: glutamine amidotransferase [Candidatus Nephthysia bennettiae]|uniref:DJ-1/PfpI family protein n=1 Tax=Candidatus Nephthysia bennettiae TaxID=3127016 RepID=A0A934K7D5_9BACT|nr:DJ-1/PfpI family protein [Candidatus Dormibacteraeota bacterium]MBJ7610945.1 DJ-1/PfpI family protein [Candidatus Dormibacteraeota bacterium]PZR92701.1 MAG: glutamine amidotransferase [Candidatus Dormibacteraeota bacterium]